MVGFDRDERIIEAMKALGWPAERSWFSTRCDDHPTYLMLIKAGLGIGFVQTKIAQRDPSLEQLFPDFELPELDVSLAAHEKMLQVPRVRAIWEQLEIRLKPALR